MSQNEQILKALKAGEKITPIEALERFGCFRLGARIADLKKMGYNIQRKTERLGGKHWACYFIENGGENGQ